MKKIVIILAVILTSTLTALSITRSANTSTAVKASVEKTATASKSVNAPTATELSTAD
jgi:hypothetical protein